MKTIHIITILLVTLLMAGCASNKKTTPEGDTNASAAAIGADQGRKAGSAYIPKAVIYKTNGNYDQHVMVNLNDSRTAITSYPGITDVNSSSSPIDLGDGWKLDRRGGIGHNSAFLTYTYAEYASLPKQPSVKELYSKIIPDARVTSCEVLPVTYSEALANPEALKKYLTEE